MAANRYIDRICAAAAVLALALTLLFVNGAALGLRSAGRSLGYEDRLFDAGRVHSLDIVIDDWDGFLSTCTSEEYSPCSVIIDGEAVKNVGIRGKGNTSLSTVARMDSQRYSFKIEFDQYESGKSYYGLDKLCLNNLIQDNTMMKDFLTYQLMDSFGVASPLSSFVYITVNGEDWGLYLAVEGVEDAFLQRNYGSGSGALYKPDSSDISGGRGSGKDFAPEQQEVFGERALQKAGALSGQGQENQRRENQGQDEQSGGMVPPGGDFPAPDGELLGEAERPGGGNGFPSGETGAPGGGKDMMGGGPGAMSSADVKLQYIDGDPDSYPNIFDNAKTEVTQADQRRLIASLKSLSACEDLEQVLDVEEVLRYFVVHNFLVNGDSYTGSIVHNYYLREFEGKLSMIPWDYNLAFGGFQNGSASAAVNEAIDDVLDDRPMQAWIFSSESYTQQYHQLYEQFLNSLEPETLIDQTAALIAPYVERDPTKFCTSEEFAAGVTALKSFCALRTESVRGQLAGTIPSTSQGQREDASALVDTGTLELSDMGSMNMGGGPGGAEGDAQGSAQAQPAFAPQDGGGLSAPPGGRDVPASGADSAVLLLLGISAAVLALGLAFAFKFKR